MRATAYASSDMRCVDAGHRVPYTDREHSEQARHGDKHRQQNAVGLREGGEERMRQPDYKPEKDRHQGQRCELTHAKRAVT
eukprot:1025283-Rhodomonas_salina.5